jgi:hypothetical protein
VARHESFSSNQIPFEVMKKWRDKVKRKNPTGRGRGRPRKPRPDAEEAEPKRGRGRPRKYPPGSEGKRPRGRPRKDSYVTLQMIAKDDEAANGSPSESDSSESDGYGESAPDFNEIREEQEEEEDNSAPLVITSEPPPKRKRGRPRKHPIQTASRPTKRQKNEDEDYAP